LKKDVLPYWGDRDARTITSREIIERLDEIVARGAPVMANRTAAIFSQMFTFGVHRSIIGTGWRLTTIEKVSPLTSRALYFPWRGLNRRSRSDVQSVKF
jgi:hypothetical protein